MSEPDIQDILQKGQELEQRNKELDQANCILSSKFPRFERLKIPMFSKGIPLFERD